MIFILFVSGEENEKWKWHFSIKWRWGWSWGCNQIRGSRALIFWILKCETISWFSWVPPPSSKTNAKQIWFLYWKFVKILHFSKIDIRDVFEKFFKIGLRVSRRHCWIWVWVSKWTNPTQPNPINEINKGINLLRIFIF